MKSSAAEPGRGLVYGSLILAGGQIRVRLTCLKPSSSSCRKRKRRTVRLLSGLSFISYGSIRVVNSAKAGDLPSVPFVHPGLGRRGGRRSAAVNQLDARGAHLLDGSCRRLRRSPRRQIQ